ncbi:MAG: hypothetical protein J6B04_00765 [Clostridia bacterium]|nr:hypothetical protein [Clostridia bacterium]
MPDLRVLIQIAEIYNITLDELVKPLPDKKIKPKLNLGKKRMLITLLSIGLVWFVATGVFAIFRFIPQTAQFAYLSFLAAPFVSSIVATVFSVLWGRRLTNTIACSALLWTFVLMLSQFLSAFNLTDLYWLFYIVAAPFQILIILWFVFRKVK